MGKVGHGRKSCANKPDCCSRKGGVAAWLIHLGMMAHRHRLLLYEFGVTSSKGRQSPSTSCTNGAIGSLCLAQVLKHSD